MSVIEKEPLTAEERYEAAVADYAIKFSKESEKGADEGLGVLINLFNDKAEHISRRNIFDSFFPGSGLRIFTEMLKDLFKECGGLDQAVLTDNEHTAMGKMMALVTFGRPNEPRQG